MSRSTNEPEPLQAATTQPNVALPRYVRALGSPALGTGTAVLAATAANAGINTGAGITNPDVPRNVTATPSGTTANVLAVQAVITGTDFEDQALTETLPAFTAGAATVVTGVKAFKAVTNVTVPALGSAVLMAVGLGTKLGLPRRMARNAVGSAFLNGVKEATAPTVVFDAANISGNTVSLNSALAGTAVVVDLGETLI